MPARRLTFTSERKPGLVEVGIISGSAAVHIKAPVMLEVVYCIGKMQFEFPWEFEALGVFKARKMREDLCAQYEAIGDTSATRISLSPRFQ